MGGWTGVGKAEKKGQGAVGGGGQLNGANSNKKKQKNWALGACGRAKPPDNLGSKSIATAPANAYAKANLTG